MIDKHTGEFHDDESGSETSPKLSRRGLLGGLFALPIAALDASSAEAQSIGIGPFRVDLGATGGRYYNGGGGYPYRTRRPPRQAAHHHSGGGGGSRHASRRSRRGGGGNGGGGGGDTGGGANSSATGLGKADY
jgi:hypothetical protein